MPFVPRGKARLHLLAEKSLGLASVPRGKSVKTQAAPVELARSASAAATKPAAARAATPPSPPRPAIAATTPTALFAGTDGPPTEPITAPVLPTDLKRLALAQMDEREVRICTACRLCQTRTHTVFGEGDVDARLMFIGEGPGENEDLSGRPFVGRAGDLLERQINAMGLARDRVFIANIVKCRPPGNRAPAPDETLACTPFLVRQIEIVRPAVIVTLGLPATQFVLSTKIAMGKLRGNWHAWRGIDVMPTYHPAYLLRNYTDEVRRMVWSDLQQVMERLGLAAPRKEI